ncbi:MAG: nucleotidyltransferase family protein, partial [Devosia sp.]
AATLARRWRAHVERRALLLARLTELVLALNAEAMVPVLLKGARSLWTGEPEWRSMRDLDVLVPGEAQERAQAMAREMGYTEWHEQGKGFHHGTNLYRPDMPGWIEIHRRAATGAADILLPTPQLVETSVSIVRGGAEAKVLRPDYDLLHALAHHHLGHRGARDGVIDLKGLVEFADQFARLGDDERVALGELVARDPRRIAMLDLWLASAHERLGLTIRAPFALVADAERRARRIAQGGSGTAGNIVSEIGLATNGERLRRAVGGQSLKGRMRLRFRIFRSVFRVAKLRGALRGPRP